jgi:hypothetical protein
MAGIVQNKAQFFKELDHQTAKVEKLFRTRVRLTVSEGLRRLIAKTPVFTGEAVANYVATAGTPYSGPIKQGFEPVEATNDLPLGAERNRARAEAVALATLSAVNFDAPFQAFHVTNRSPQIRGLEAGELPGKGRPSRSPNGMFVITNEELLEMLRSGKI